MPGAMTYRMIIATQFSQTKAELRALQNSWMATRTVMESVTKAMMLGIGHIAAVGGAFFAVTAILKDYEAALVRAGAIGGMTATQTAMMGQKINQSAIQFGASVQEMSEGIIELTKAGFEFNDVMEVIDTVTKVNIANNLDFASSAEIATLVMKGFKVPTKDLAGHFDKLQYVVNKTLMDMGDFVELLRYAGSSAIVSGVAPERLYAMAGALSDVAQQAGIGARGVNRLMIEMLKETDQVQKWADSLGMSVEIIKDGTLNLDGLIRAFHEYGMNIDVAISSMEQFSIRSARAWLGLLNNADEYFALVEGQKDAMGYLDSVVGPQLDTISNRLARLKNEFLAAFRTPEFINQTKKALDNLHVGVMSLVPPLRDLLMNLLKQAPGVLDMLFTAIQNLLPLLTGGLLPIFKAMSDVLASISGGSGWLMRFILIMMLLKRMVPVFSLTFQVLTAAMYGTADAALMLKNSISGALMGLVILWSLKDKVKWAALAIAGAIAAIAIAIAAVKAAGGDWITAVKVGLTMGGLAAGWASTAALMSATGQESRKYEKKYLETQAAGAQEVLGSFQTGTRYVPRTGMYLLHEGEPVGTAAAGVFKRGGGGSQLTFINRGTLYGSEEALTQLVRRIMRREAGEAYM